MKCCLVFAALIWSTGLSFGQNDVSFYMEQGAHWVVIAPAGLHLRAKPDQRGKILATAPFGDTAVGLASKEIKRDTVGSIESWSDVHQSRNTPIDGFWLKVRYRGAEGYMFSAYLSRGVNKLAEGDEALNQDYILLFPGIGCFENYFYHPGWYWYGIYQSDTTKSIQPVKISFYNLPGELVGNCVVADKMRNLHLIIGSRTPLPLSLNSAVFLAEQYQESNSLIGREGEPNDALLRRYHLNVVRDGSTNFWETQKLVLQQGGQQQVLAKPGQFSDGGWYLVCCGDLDGDQKKDYIIWYGEKGSKTILYLSKPAAKGQLVKPVAVYYAGYCC